VNAALCLVGYGVAVAALAPPLLIRTAGTGCAPRLGVVAWLLAMVTATGSVLGGMAALVGSANAWLATFGWAVLVASVVRASWAGVATWSRVRARRRAHRQLVAILGRPDPVLGVVMVEAAERLVYCLPAPVATVVVTTAARDALSGSQLSAVLAHERTHLAGRHHILLAVVNAASRAVPWLTLYAQAAPQIAALLEMRADDAAARTHGRRTVAAAIAAMSARSAPAGALGAAGPSALQRGLRLCQAEPTWRARLGRLAVAITVAALAAGPYLSAILPPCPHPWW
jgi:Zn-dependent protease with chaperone function